MNDLSPQWLNEHACRLAREDFGFFAMRAFSVLYDEPYQHNWHVNAIALELILLTTGVNSRLIITMPPRTLKSFIASICLPAWLLGRNPAEKIICASYAQPLANDFAFQMRRLMQSDWYHKVFPGTHINPKKSSVEEIATTRGGYRLSTSVGGTLTGRGGNYIIIDDPMKAVDAHSEVARAAALNWYTGTVASRFNNPKTGRMVLVAQRLHMEDLPGQLAAMGGWQQLDLPLIAWQPQDIEIFPGVFLSRPVGNLLHEKRIGEKEIAQLKAELGAQSFDAQYNQRPLPPGGALFKLPWLQRYEHPPQPHQVEATIQSWDTAYDVHDHNDYSVCSTWAISGKRYYLLDIYRERLEFPDLEKAIYQQRDKWNADLVIVESAGSGISIFQNVRRATGKFWITSLKPEGSKKDRASQQSPKFERGEVWIPTEAPWLKIFLDELAGFPHTKHDDQVDSVIQFLAALDSGNLRNAIQSAKSF
jgi:predicted phage terminase large subunit-like protein